MIPLYKVCGGPSAPFGTMYFSDYIGALDFAFRVSPFDFSLEQFDPVSTFSFIEVFGCGCTYSQIVDYRRLPNVEPLPF